MEKEFRFKRQNKKRNTGLLYEVLIKHISKCLIENNHKEANKALEISKKYFSEGMPLKNELKLFQSVLTSKNVSKEAMSKILDYACKSAGLMNNRILEEEKSKLIKEINYNLNKKVYDYKVSDYINYSSLQTLFNDSRNKNKKLDEIFKIKIKDAFVNRVLETKNNNVKMELKPEINNIVYKTLVKKFAEKYAKLTENQNKFLMQYTLSMLAENKEQFHNFILSENKKIMKSLTEIKDIKILKDKELVKKIKECKEKYQKEVLGAKDTESVVLGMLQYLALVEELSAI